jgi:transposase-like protein
MNGRQKFCLPPPRPKEERERAEALFRAGRSYQEISEDLKLPLSTLRNWRKRFKWGEKKSDPQAAIAHTDSGEIEPPVFDTLEEKQAFYQEQTQEAAVKLAAHLGTMLAPELVRHADKLSKADKTARAALKLESERVVPLIQIGILASSPAKADAARLHSYTKPVKVEQLG